MIKNTVVAKKIFGTGIVLVLLLYHLISFYGGPIGINNSLNGKTQYLNAQTSIKLDGLVFKNKSGNNFILRSVAPDCSIRVNSKIKNEIFDFEIFNVNPERTAVKGGAENIKISHGRVSFTVSAAEGEKKISITQDSKDFFFYVWADNRSESPFSDSSGGYFVMKRIINAAKKERPLFMIAAGDLMPSPKYYHYRRLNSFLKKMKPVPFYSAPGNHDIWPAGTDMWEKIVSPSYYSFVKNGFLFILLDNTSGSLGAVQFGWLEDKLKNQKNQKAILFFHKPLYDPREGQNYVMENAEEREKLSALIEKYTPAAVFDGHIHGFWHYKKGKTDFFITGGGGSRLRQENGFYHYLKISPSAEGGLDWKIVKLSHLPTAGFLLEFSGNLIFLFFVGKYLIFFKEKQQEDT